MTRSDVIARLQSLRHSNELAGLAFYAYRDLNQTEAEPFLRAALERCPVSVAACAGLTDEAVVAAVHALPDDSIYDEPGRLAQPDEVWNYGRGDGVEKALLLANVLRARHPGSPLRIVAAPDKAVLVMGSEAEVAPPSARPTASPERTPGVHTFPSRKRLTHQTWHCGAGHGHGRPYSNSSVSSEV